MMHLLILSFWINGYQGVDVTRFSTQRECQSALAAIYQVLPNVSAQCKAVPYSNNNEPASESQTEQ